MKAPVIIVGVVLIVLIIGAVVFFNQPAQTDSSSQQGAQAQAGNAQQAQDSASSSSGSAGSATDAGADSAQDTQNAQDQNQQTPQTHTIAITSSGFSPSTLEISQGDTVVFINQDSAMHWPATDVHPTHTLYPGSDISKCGTPQASEIFDACRGLAQGETYSFTFNEKGSWTYHDHLRPSWTGTIVVN
ncbi:hypothetical protein D6817_01510 [Candidatus Pacearchaeota archaeon]|nr:MAG: hypothetical protein D6817_01510 [Candidatus Pacearchaeota archaeon]